MRLLLPVALGLVATAALESAHADEVRVFMLAGQSNATGYGEEAVLSPELSSQPDVLYDFWNNTARLPGGDYAVSVSTDWGPLEPKALQSGGPRRFGPELTFGRTVADGLGGRRIAIVKVSAQGTNILEHWERGVSPDVDYQEKSQLYHALLGSLDSATYGSLAYPDEPTRLDGALARLAARGDTYQVAGVIWLQGENESGWSAAFTYEEHLRGFVAALREDLGVPDLPFVLTRVSLNAAASNGGPLPDANLDAVRAAQTAVADGDPRIALVDTDDLLPDEPGGLHFTSEGYLTLGERLGEAYLALPRGAGGGEPATSSSTGSGSSGSGAPGSTGSGGSGGGPGGEADEEGGGCAAGRGRAPTGSTGALGAVAVALLCALRRRR